MITGAGGFVGSALVAEAAQSGLPVLAVSRRSQDFVHSGVTTVRVDDYACFTPPANSVLIHLAEPPSLVAAHVSGERHLTTVTKTLSSLLSNPWLHVVYASSVVVYGDQSMEPHYPDETVHPKDYYARAKVACEAAVTARCGTVMRLANIYGPGLSKGTILSDLLDQLYEEGPIRVRNAGPERDYLWVRDAASGLLAAALRQAGGIYNLASGRAISVLQLAKIVTAAVGQPCRPVESVAEPSYSRISVDIADTINHFFWQPQTSIEEGINRLVSIYR